MSDPTSYGLPGSAAEIHLRRCTMTAGYVAMVCREAPLRYTVDKLRRRSMQAMVCREAPLRYTSAQASPELDARAMVCREAPLRYTSITLP